MRPPQRRGGTGDGVRLSRVEHLQLTLRTESEVDPKTRERTEPSPERYGVEVEFVTLVFDP
jgi:hypothetical protein